MRSTLLTFEVTVNTEDDRTDDMERFAEMLCDVMNTMLEHEDFAKSYDGTYYTMGDAQKDTGPFITNVAVYGNSLALNVTKAAKKAGIGRDDKVVVRIMKIPGGTQE